jgi:hypothetical protein
MTTTTDIARRDEPDTAPMPASALVLWAYEAQQAHQIAISLSKTSFVPATLRGKPDDITAAILAGQELGLKPMATLRSMDIIGGTPALRAHAMRGLVQSHGHQVTLVEQTPTKVVMRGARRIVSVGAPQYEPEQESVWTIERAALLGLTGKPEWKKQPQTMLTARATGEICRLIAADVLFAMPYAAEELDGTIVEHADYGRQRVTAAEIMGQAAPAPGPASDPEPAPAAEPDTDDGRAGGMLPVQGRKIHALFRARGITERDDKLRWMSEVLGREVTTSKELSMDDASRVIDDLDNAPSPAAPEADPAGNPLEA